MASRACLLPLVVKGLVFSEKLKIFQKSYWKVIVNEVEHRILKEALKNCLI